MSKVQVSRHSPEIRFHDRFSQVLQQGTLPAEAGTKLQGLCDHIRVAIRLMRKLSIVDRDFQTKRTWAWQDKPGLVRDSLQKEVDYLERLVSKLDTLLSDPREMREKAGGIHIALCTV